MGGAHLGPQAVSHPARRFAIAYEALIAVVAVICVIGLPMGGLVLRFALRPLVQDLTSAMNDDARQRLGELQERVAALESQMDVQSDALNRLLEAEQFRQQLEAGDGGS